MIFVSLCFVYHKSLKCFPIEILKFGPHHYQYFKQFMFLFSKMFYNQCTYYTVNKQIYIQIHCILFIVINNIYKHVGGWLQMIAKINYTNKSKPVLIITQQYIFTTIISSTHCQASWSTSPQDLSS